MSHEHRFIFMKTRKTAGTSIEIALSRYCGSEDAITRILPEDEAIRAELGLGPQNFTYPIPARKWGRRHLGDLARLRRPTRDLMPHTNAMRARRHVGTDVWDAYFKFCFIRNPWDRFVSSYYWEVDSQHGSHIELLSLDHFLARWNPARDTAMYMLDGRVAVDFVGRFERLTDDLRTGLATVGIEYDGWLPTAKATTGRNRRSYRDVLEPHHVEFIREQCRDEIERFGYEF